MSYIAKVPFSRFKALWLGPAKGTFATTIGQMESRNDYTKCNRDSGAVVFNDPSVLIKTTKTIMSHQKIKQRYRSAYNIPKAEYLYNAVGRYQVIGAAMCDFYPFVGDTLFNQCCQDYYLVYAFLHKIGAHRFPQYFEGRMSEDDAMQAIALEWASFPNPRTGVSNYSQVGTNKSHIDVPKFRQQLRLMKEEVQGYLAAGQELEWAIVSALMGYRVGDKSVAGRVSQIAQQTVASLNALPEANAKARSSKGLPRTRAAGVRGASSAAEQARALARKNAQVQSSTKVENGVIMTTDKYGNIDVKGPIKSKPVYPRSLERVRGGSVTRKEVRIGKTKVVDFYDSKGRRVGGYTVNES